MLQMRFCLSQIARLTNLTCPHALSDCSFHSCSLGILLLERFCLLSFSPCLQRDMLRLGSERYRPARRCRACALGTTRADSTIRRRELNFDHLILPFVDCWRPTDT